MATNKYDPGTDPDLLNPYAHTDDEQPDQRTQADYAMTPAERAQLRAALPDVFAQWREEAEGWAAPFLAGLDDRAGTKTEVKMAPNQPRDDHGRWTSTGAGTGAGHGGAVAAGAAGGISLPTGDAVHLQADLIANGGFTYQPVTHTAPHDGLMLSIYPDREQITRADQVTAKALRTYVDKNSDLLSKPDHYVGGWHDTHSGQVYLDVSVRVTDHAQARKMCEQYSQEAYFDLGTGQTVYVGAHKEGAGTWQGKEAMRFVRFQLPRNPTDSDLQAVAVSLKAYRTK